MVSELAQWSRVPTTRMSRGRLAVGAVVVVLVVATAVLFGFGAWNPWRLVVLRQWLANPWLGLLLVAAGAYLAIWLLAPVRHEAVQRGRIAIRVVVALVGVIALFGTGISYVFYRYDPSELNRSADGERAIVLVTTGAQLTRELHVWEGTGLATRQLGSLGRACGGVKAWFAERDVIVVDQGYGEWRFRLDPDTGAPREVFGPRCPDGPVPATLGP